MVDYTKNPEQARERLPDSVVMVDGKAFYISAVSGGKTPTVVGRWVATDQGENIPLSKLDVNPPKLGFVMVGGLTYYTTREPRRIYRQGLTTRSIIMTSLTGYKRRWNGGFYPLVAPLENKYETLEQNMEDIVNEELTSLPLSRTVCVQQNGKGLDVFYKTTKVGTVNEDNGAFKLETNKRFLERAIRSSNENFRFC